MSGVDISDRSKNKQNHQCEPCMKTVVQTFRSLHTQINQLNNDRLRLQIEIEETKKEQKEQYQNYQRKIRTLEKKLTDFKKTNL
jgi:hypothetical protein